MMMFFDKLIYPKKINISSPSKYHDLEIGYCSVSYDMADILTEGIRLISEYDFQCVYLILMYDNTMYCQFIDGTDKKFYSDNLDINIISSTCIAFGEKDDTIYVYKGLRCPKVNKMIEYIYKALYNKIPLYSGNVFGTQLDCEKFIWYNMDYMYIPLKNLVRKIIQSLYIRFKFANPIDNHVYYVKYMEEMNSPYLMQKTFLHGDMITVVDDDEHFVYDQSKKIWYMLCS